MNTVVSMTVTLTGQDAMTAAQSLENHLWSLPATWDFDIEEISLDYSKITNNEETKE